MEYRIVNIVSTVNLNTRIDPEVAIEHLKKIGHVTYEPRRFPGIVISLERTLGKKIAILLFRNGKMVIAGGKTVDDVKEAVKTLLRALAPILPSMPSTVRIQIQNMVATINVNRLINLELLVGKLENIMYEPEEFPGLIYRPGLGKPVLLIFSTGKIVVAGAKDEEEIREACRIVQEKILSTGHHEFSQ